ncbi:hypothetical protein IJH46_00660 [Candidatus Saccharibacteria bacterium]|nr:hypothetical protein [Candidatus Saccharibacteria bacterium]
MKRKRLVLGIVLICVVAIAARALLVGPTSLGGDLELFLQPWSEELRANGGLPGLSDYPGNYNAPYMTILALLTYLPIEPGVSIRIVSFLFDFLLAGAAVLLAKELLRGKEIEDKKRTGICLMVFSLTLLLPTVLLNSGAWCQCDSIYTAFGILAIVALCRERYMAAVVLAGTAFAFKLQAVFLLPAFGIIWLMKLGEKRGRKFSLLNFLLFPLPDFILSLPAIMNGMPVKRLFTVYLEQTTYYSERLTLNFPNVYTFLPEGVDTGLLSKVGILVALFALGGIAILCLKNWKEVTAKRIVELSIMTLMALVFLLPSMHERYYILGEILILIYTVALERDYWLLVGTQVLMVSGYFYLGVFCPGIMYIYTALFLGMAGYFGYGVLREKNVVE